MLFGNKKTKLPELPSGPAPADFNTATDYFVGLSDDEYAKAIKFVEAYRKANIDGSKAIGVKPEVYSHIKPPSLGDMSMQDLGIDYEDIPDTAKGKKQPRKKTAKK